MRNPVCTSMPRDFKCSAILAAVLISRLKVPGIDENAFSIQSPLIQYLFACWSIFA